MPEVGIRAITNGPYEVKGGAKVTDHRGTEDGDGTIYLCRRGRSGNKPFCDGTHKQVGFKAEETAG